MKIVRNNDDSIKINAHVCRTGKIKEFPKLLCSMCGLGDGWDVQMTKTEIEKYNEKVKNNEIR